MADNQPPKRRVKSPETFRQRALKASQPEKPSKVKHLAGLISKPFKAALSPVGKAIKRLFGLKVMRPVAFMLRWIGRILWPRYLRNSWRELRLVSWPSWKESRRLTYAVLAFAIIFGSAIAAVDYGLDKVFRHILLK